MIIKKTSFECYMKSFHICNFEGSELFDNEEYRKVERCRSRGDSVERG